MKKFSVDWDLIGFWIAFIAGFGALMYAVALPFFVHSL